MEAANGIATLQAIHTSAQEDQEMIVKNYDFRKTLMNGAW
jgi:hypothetical protein